MNKQQATRLMNKAVKAFNAHSSDFESIMDDASVSLSDEQWVELGNLLNEALKTPVLPETPKQEQERLEATVARLRIGLENAEKALYSFYARNYARKRSTQ